MKTALRRQITPLPLLGLLATLACTADAQPQAETEAQAPSQPAITLETATALDVRNARMPVPGLVTAGQPTQEQFDGLVAAGFENFISLRLADEGGAGWEEEYAPGAGVSFTRLPVSGNDGLSREAAEELGRLLDAAGDEGTVLYCGSSNRVGALLALKAFWVDGVSAEDALALGKAAGVTRMESTLVELLGLSEN